ncbi:PREDICTED: uncharacterized protein KIAA1143 homolog [Corvus brachyrhynchos]|nr:PREDICTED: uncharacterized protein KIAA1143 homolog [Corvus brachyrhynchos]
MQGQEWDSMILVGPFGLRLFRDSGKGPAPRYPDTTGGSALPRRHRRAEPPGHQPPMGHRAPPTRSHLAPLVLTHGCKSETRGLTHNWSDYLNGFYFSLVQREQLSLANDDSDNGSDREDEQPQVVTLKKGDLTAEEAMKIKQQIKEALKSNESDDEPEPADGKIMFRKPAKRSSEKCLDFNVSSSKKMKEAKKTKREATTSQSTAKQVKNSSLLSFDDEENDD